MARRKRLSEAQQERRVELSYEEFTRMAPSLSQYASAYARKRVSVVAGPRTETDGHTIFIRPPLVLAEQPIHERRFCGERYLDGKFRCEACQVRQVIMAMMHHEIAHIAHGSFDKYLSVKVRELVFPAFNYHLPRYSTALNNFLYGLSNDKKVQSLEIASKIHQHLAMIHLVTEDHRINTASFRREPALWKRMHDLSEEILVNGVEMDDGTFNKWQDRDPDSQMIGAPLFYMEGFDIANYFNQEVVNCVFDPRVKTILDRIAHTKNSLENLCEAAQLLKLYREHGFFTEHTEPIEEQNPEDEELAEAFEELMKVLKELFGHGSKIGGEGDDTCDEVGSGGGGTEKPDESTMVKVITAKKYLDNVPGHIAGVQVFNPGEGPCSHRDYERFDKAPESIIGNAVAKSRVAFGVNARAQTHRNQKSGKIDSRSLGKRAWNPDDGRLFKSHTVPDKRDYEVLIGFDISGSTRGGYDEEVSRIRLLKYSACALADTMHRLGVKFSIFAHNTGRVVSSDVYGASMDIYKLKLTNEPWTDEIRERVKYIGSGGSNLDGHTLQFYRKELDKSRATDKILMYFTDGIMPGMATNQELPVLKDEIEVCRKRGYTLLGVGVFTDAPKDHGLPTVQVDSEADYPRVIDHLAKRLTGVER